MLIIPGVFIAWKESILLGVYIDVNTDVVSRHRYDTHTKISQPIMALVDSFEI